MPITATAIFGRRSVWQVSCWLEQLIRHDALEVALLVVVAASVDAVPGTTQADWQVAACELQAIMQFVVVEVCARRIFPPADAVLAKPATATTRTERPSTA